MAHQYPKGSPLVRMIRRPQINSKNGPYSYTDNGDGTSYATALTTGVAALWLTYRADEITAKYGKSWKRVWAFKKIASDTARVPAVWGPDVAGSGILDAGGALNLELPTATLQDWEPPI